MRLRAPRREVRFGFLRLFGFLLPFRLSGLLPVLFRFFACFRRASKSREEIVATTTSGVAENEIPKIFKHHAGDGGIGISANCGGIQRRDSCIATKIRRSKREFSSHQFLQVRVEEFLVDVVADAHFNLYFFKVGRAEFLEIAVAEYL